MPIILILLGLAVIISGARGEAKKLGDAIAEDFKGPNSFLVWVGAVLCIGFLGYGPKLQGFSRALLTLILISFVLSNNGVFTKLKEALSNPPASQPAIPIEEGGSGGSGGSGGAGGAIEALGTIAKFATFFA